MNKEEKERLEEIAMAITNKIMVFAIDNHLLNESADNIIKAYKKSIKGGK